MIFIEKKYDLTFVGLGASNSLIINALYSSHLLQKLSIAVIEPDTKSKNDKTYCFWANPEEVKTLHLSALTDKSWSMITCNSNEITHLAPVKYYHISSISLYDHVKQILSQCNVDYYRESLTNIEWRPIDNLICLSTENAKFQSIKVFDSRPPQWLEAQKHQAFLWQSFLGWKIKTSEPVFDKNVFTMMDFEVDQSDATQFVYILPYDNNYALVELTRFGINGIDHDYARIQLEKYCREKNWNITLIEEEQGMIPMCSKDIKQRSIHTNHIQTGSAAGKVKPTTGYAFKEMAYHSVQIANSFSNIKSFSKEEINQSRRGRFAFYDRILLKILEKNPDKGKLIFTSLFKNVDSKLVLKFLEQKTELKEDITVMMSLPKGIFIKQALLDCMNRIQPLLSYLFPLLTTFLFLVLNHWGLNSVGLFLLSVGLIALGIPHGAMDHILEKPKNKKIFGFVSGYLLKGTVMFFLWKLSPLIALVLFLIYSAWHFGQADFIQWKLTSEFSSFVWGLGMLLFILFSHTDETRYVLSQLFNDNSLTQAFLNSSVMGVVLSFLLMCFSLIQQRNRWLTISFITIILLSFIPLLQAFGIFFICQHSLNGWSQIKERLHKKNMELWEHSLPFTLGAFVLFLIFFTNKHLFWKEQIGSFFIFLSCISFPHVINMDKFYRKQKITG